VYTNNAVLRVAGSSFAGNAAQQGGALGGSGVSWDLSNTSFANHTVAGPGGAILLSGGLDTTLSGCSISHNRWVYSILHAGLPLDLSSVLAALAWVSCLDVPFACLLNST
jgi:hypothetical protein